MFESITHPQKRAFLAAYSECGMVSRAAAIAGISRESHYDWRANDPDYADAFELARERAGDAAEDEARLRGQLGVEEYVLYQGEMVLIPTGEVDADGNVVNMPLKRRKVSDKLLAMILAAHKPAYRTKHVEHSGTVKHRHGIDLSKLTEEELTLLERIADKTSADPDAGRDRGGAHAPQPSTD